MPRLPLLLLAVGCLLPLSGCCSLGRFFCGPDRSPWISVDFETPEKAVKTLLEAIRRDDPEVVYLCLSEDYRHRLGLDLSTSVLAWDKVREANPGLHLAGYASVPTPDLHGHDHASVALDVEGHRVEIALVRQGYRELRYRRDDGSPADQGEVVQSFVGFARIEPVDKAKADDRSQVLLKPMPFHHDGEDSVPLEALEHVALTHRWKIAELRMPAP